MVWNALSEQVRLRWCRANFTFSGCPDPSSYFKTSPEISRLGVMMDVGSVLSLRNVEDLLDQRGIHVSHETVRFQRNRSARRSSLRPAGSGPCR